MADLELEARIRATLKRKDMAEASDREVGRTVGCNKNVVRRIRTGLIAAGILPKKPVSWGKSYSTDPVRIRGGYLLLKTGQVVGELEHYLEQQRKAKGKSAARRKAAK